MCSAWLAPGRPGSAERTAATTRPLRAMIRWQAANSVMDLVGHAVGRGQRHTSNVTLRSRGVEVGQLRGPGDGSVAAGFGVRRGVQVWVAAEVGGDVVRVGADLDKSQGQARRESGDAVGTGQRDVRLRECCPTGFNLDADGVAAGVHGFHERGADADEGIQHDVALRGVGLDRVGGEVGEHPRGVGAGAGDQSAAALRGGAALCDWPD